MNNNTNGKGPDTFQISEYAHLLVQSEGQRGKQLCPACGDGDFSFNPKTNNYSCSSKQCDESIIARKLRDLNGESTNQTSSPPSRNTSKSTAKDDDKDGRKISTNTKALDFFKEIKWDENLGFNVRSSKLTLKRADILADTLHFLLAEDYRVNISNDMAIKAALHFGKEHPFDPVEEWLLSLHQSTPLDPLESLIKRMLKIDEPYHIESVKRWAMGCVARAFNPGCKFDEALVLQGKGRIGKSSFFRILSNGFFSDSMPGDAKPDSLRTLHEHWICEWGEIDSMTHKTYHGVIKNLLSRQEDDYRLPYARDLIRMPRRSVIVGSTNADHYLKDTTGNRRFLNVPLTERIDLPLVEKIRPEFWLSAIAEHRADPILGHTLPEKYWEQQDEENLNYLYQDPWEEILNPFLDCQNEVTILELLNRLQGHDNPIPYKYSRSDDMRLADLLKSKGWKRKHKRVGGGYKWVYVKTEG